MPDLLPSVLEAEAQDFSYRFWLGPRCRCFTSKWDLNGGHQTQTPVSLYLHS